jgi:hypothetical protein
LGERLSLFLPTKIQAALVLNHRGETGAWFKKKRGQNSIDKKSYAFPQNKYHLQIHFKQTVHRTACRLLLLILSLFP